MENSRNLYPLAGALLLAAVAMGCPEGRKIETTFSQAQTAERQIATVETEPIYAKDVDGLVKGELKARRNATSIFHEPSPEDLARLKGMALQGLLLEAVYRKPGMTFNKERAQELTREVTLERARAIKDALESGVPRQEILDTLVAPAYRNPTSVDFDQVDSKITNPAYKDQALNTPEGGVSQIVEDKGGLYVLKILRRTKLDSGETRIEGEHYYVQFDRDLGKRRLKEEDLGRSKVVIQDATLRAIRHIEDAEASDDMMVRLDKLEEAKAELETALKSNNSDHFNHFLMGWVTASLAADPTSGATKEQAVAHLEKAAELLADEAPGDPSLGYYYARIGSMQRDLGQLDAARASYAQSLAAAKDNYPLSLELVRVFTDLGDTESAAKVQADIDRMEKTMDYSTIAASGKVRQNPGVIAEGTEGTEQVFQVEGTPRVIEDE